MALSAVLTNEGERVKICIRLGFAALCVGIALARGAAFAADTDAFLGTWVLNAAKSQVPQGAMPDKATIVVSDGGAGKLKTVSDTTMVGTAIHAEITFAIDGKDYAPITTPAPPPGSPTILESFERVSPLAVKAALKLNGETIATVLQEVSADGKTLKMTTTGLGAAAGVTSLMTFDKK